jgi:hypothetical protein
MKFQKGLLSDSEDKARKSEVSIKLSEADRTALRPVAAPPTTTPQPVAPVVVDKDRLFETVKETNSSSKKYLAVLGVVVVLVIAAGIGGSYYMAPGIGDKILAPKGLEVAIRENFLTKQKRDSTDISYYKCEGFVWARVGVETRNDLPNPVFKIGTYAAKATPNGDAWDISAVPISSAELDVPCK